MSDVTGFIAFAIVTAVFTAITKFLLGDIDLVTWKVALWISLVVVMILAAIHNS